MRCGAAWSAARTPVTLPEKGVWVGKVTCCSLEAGEASTIALGELFEDGDEEAFDLVFEVASDHRERLLYGAHERLDGFLEKDVTEEAPVAAFAEDDEAEPDGLGNGNCVGGEWLVFQFVGGTIDAMMDGGLDIG